MQGSHKAVLSTSTRNLEKHVHILCPYIISKPTRHTNFSISSPLNLLPHVSSNIVGHLELKNLSAYLFFWSTNSNVYDLGLIIHR